MESPLDTNSEESMEFQGELYKVGSRDNRDSFQVKEAQGFLWFVERWIPNQATITVQHGGFRIKWSKEWRNIDGEVFFAW